MSYAMEFTSLVFYVDDIRESFLTLFGFEVILR